MYLVSKALDQTLHTSGLGSQPLCSDIIFRFSRLVKQIRKSIRVPAENYGGAIYGFVYLSQCFESLFVFWFYDLEPLSLVHLYFVPIHNGSL